VTALSFTVHEAPVPKARARVMAAGWSFTPKRTRDFEAKVREEAVAAVAATPGWRTDVDMRVRVAVYRARRAGDLDNFAKAITDSMNRIVYEDDRQIRELHTLLFDDKDDPRALVEVEPL